MRYLSILLFLFIPLAFSNCHDDEELPPITMEGKNTFGCRVNGKLWLPEGRLGQSATYAELQLPGDTVGVNLYASAEKSGIAISIYDLPNLQINKPYDLSTGKYYASYLDWSGGSSCQYDSILSGNVTLSKFDRTNNIISGIFEFTAYSRECDIKVTVTEGRFDISEIIY